MHSVRNTFLKRIRQSGKLHTDSTTVCWSIGSVSGAMRKLQYREVRPNTRQPQIRIGLDRPRADDDYVGRQGNESLRASMRFQINSRFLSVFWLSIPSSSLAPHGARATYEHSCHSIAGRRI